MTNVIQVTNVSPSTTSEQMRTLFGFLGNIEELKLFPPDESPLPVTSRVCFVKFLETESVGVSQHLTNTVFVDRALIVVPFAEGVIPDESKALSLLAPANAVAGCMPGGGLLPTPNHLASMGGVPLSALGNPNMDPMVAMGMSGNMNPQALSADFLKLMQSMDPTKMNPMAAGMMVNHGMKNDSNKEIEAAMKRVREAQSLISAAIEPGSDFKRLTVCSDCRRSKSRSRRRSHSRSWRRSKSPRRRKSHSRERGRRSKSRCVHLVFYSQRGLGKCMMCLYQDSFKSLFAFVFPVGIRRKRRNLRSAPRLRLRATKDKKKDKEREKDRDRERKEVRGRDERERSTSKKSKDQEKDHDCKSDSEKGDVKSSLLLQVTRDYDEEEQGYDSGKEVEEEERKSNSDLVSSPKPREESEKKPAEESSKKSKQNGDDHHDEDDMEMSD
uniref:Serine and arginine rich splicing factor 11 n=1 Tax=Oncorhynchus mykiss TaxID=8022 RepID=A0A8C7R0W9_ONCMY